jgi:hypothetical protein
LKAMMPRMPPERVAARTGAVTRLRMA